jgi:RNA polymerase sigma-70 factor (sigma-E family)
VATLIPEQRGPVPGVTDSAAVCDIAAGIALGGVAGADPRGFEEYVAARGAALVRFARLLTGDVHRAEDLVQDALAKAYLRWSRIRRADNPEVYIRRMLINGSHQWWRRRSNREVPADLTAERPAPGDLGTESAERDTMRRLIGNLPHRQRTVLVLRYYEDLDDAAIAEILNCSPVTVRTHAMRALRRLRNDYTNEAATGSPGSLS